MGISVPVRLTASSASCQYGRRGLGQEAMSSCFVILPRFPWRLWLLPVVIRPAKRSNLMYDRERDASSTARQSSPVLRRYRGAVKSSQTETAGAQRGRAAHTRAPSSCTSASKPSLSLRQIPTSETVGQLRRNESPKWCSSLMKNLGSCKRESTPTPSEKEVSAKQNHPVRSRVSVQPLAISHPRTSQKTRKTNVVQFRCARPKPSQTVFGVRALLASMTSSRWLHMATKRSKNSFPLPSP